MYKLDGLEVQLTLKELLNGLPVDFGWFTGDFSINASPPPPPRATGGELIQLM